MRTTGKLACAVVLVFLGTATADSSVDRIRYTLFDGRRFFHIISSPEANTWLELDIPTSNFKDKSGNALGVGENIQVITIKTDYRIVYYLYTYTILIDDFSLSGERQRQFIGVDPASFNFDKFDVSVLKKHFFHGDTISLAVTPEKGSPVNSITGNIVDSNGRTVASNEKFYDNGSNGDKVAGDGVWSNSSLYRISEKDTRGQWEIKLSGTAGGNTVDWGLKFMVPGNLWGRKTIRGSSSPPLDAWESVLDLLSCRICYQIGGLWV